MLPRSASGASRWMACPASVVLPQVQSSSRWGETGRAIHQYIQDVIEGKPSDEAVRRIPASLEMRARGINLSAILHGLSRVRAEVAFALHAQTFDVRELGAGLERAYAVSDEEIPGTLDVIAFDDANGRPVVLDWKTGQSVTACRDNRQIQFAAAVAMRTFESSEVEGRVVYLREDGSHWVDSHVFDAIDVDLFLRDVALSDKRTRQSHESLRVGGTPNVHEGDHCQYCPALAGCPAKVALAKSMLLDVQSVPETVAALTPAQAGEVWRKLATIESLAEKIKSSLKDYAKQTPIPLGDDKEVRAEPFERQTVNATKVVELAKAKGATEDELASCMTTTKGVIVRERKRGKK